MKRFLTVLLLTAVLALGAETVLIRSAEEAVSSPHDNLRWGVPMLSDDITVIDREGFAVGFSRKHRIPMWVCYVLTREEVEAATQKRTERYAADKLLPESPQPADYRGSDFSRGHMAPALDMAFSAETLEESFLMSNIAPQLAGFHRGAWKQLETWIRKTAVLEKKLVIVTGVVIGPDRKTIAKNITVPDAFYKAILIPGPRRKVFCFLLKHSENAAPVSVSQKALEKLTGCTFFRKAAKKKTPEN